jgi:hypothetical protein
VCGWFLFLNFLTIFNNFLLVRKKLIKSAWKWNWPKDIASYSKEFFCKVFQQRIPKAPSQKESYKSSSPFFHYRINNSFHLSSKCDFNIISCNLLCCIPYSILPFLHSERIKENSFSFFSPQDQKYREKITKLSSSLQFHPSTIRQQKYGWSKKRDST